MLCPLFSMSKERNGIKTNDKIIVEYVNEYIKIFNENGFTVRGEILNRIRYIIIVNDGIDVKDLGTFDKDNGVILLSNKLTKDNGALKIVLFRELSFSLGIKTVAVINIHPYETKR